LSPSRTTCKPISDALARDKFLISPSRISAQVIFRGSRSAGYGFVALATEAAAQKAVELLNKKELDGRPIIIEVAKLPEQKEKKPRSTKKRTNRRGDKAVPGEVTEAEANGEATTDKTDAEAAPASDEAAKPKKKKKPSVGRLTYPKSRLI
jgi:RNA recognition motif-containing protein